MQFRPLRSLATLSAFLSPHITKASSRPAPINFQSRYMSQTRASRLPNGDIVLSTVSVTLDPHSSPFQDVITKANFSLMVLINKAPNTATVILCHGLGDSGEGWVDGAAFLASKLPHVKFILPTAPERPVTLNHGYVCTAWYDIIGLESRNDEKCDGLDDSRKRIMGLVEEEMKNGVPSEQVILAGFSQGAALSLFTGLQSPHKLGAIIAMSGYVPRINSKDFAVNDAVKGVPVRLFHGMGDTVVKYTFAKESLKWLQGSGASDVSLTSYDDLGHSVLPEELQSIADIITKVTKEKKEL